MRISWQFLRAGGSGSALLLAALFAAMREGGAAESPGHLWRDVPAPSPMINPPSRARPQAPEVVVPTNPALPLVVVAVTSAPPAKVEPPPPVVVTVPPAAPQKPDSGGESPTPTPDRSQAAPAAPTPQSAPAEPAPLPVAPTNGTGLHEGVPEPASPWEASLRDRTVYNFQAEGLELKTALAAFALQNNLNLVPDHDVSGEVNVNLRELPLDLMMRALLEVNDCAWSRESGLIRVRTTETRVFNLTRLPDSDPASGSRTDFLPAKYRNLEQEIRGLLTPSGLQAVNLTAGVVQVTDRPSALKRVELYLRSLGATSPTSEPLIQAGHTGPLSRPSRL